MKKNKEVAYSTDENNQLLIKTSPTKDPKVIPGRFVVEQNSLVYLVDDPKGWQKDFDFPTRIRFRGKWWLSREHNLIMLLDDSSDTLTLRGRICRPEGNVFTFWLRSRKFKDTSEVSFIKLAGIWRADKNNRLTFEVTERQARGTLTLRGIWDIGKNNQIIYRYQQLKTKDKHELIFRGSWDISDKNKVGYLIEKSRGSRFDFRAYLQTPNLYPAKGLIKYRISVGLASKWEERVLVLAGEWKISRAGGLEFELDYKDGRVQRIRFGAVVNLPGRDRIVFSLTNREGRPLGITVTFTKRSLSQKDWEYFIRARRQGKELYLGGGFKLRF